MEAWLSIPVYNPEQGVVFTEGEGAGTGRHVKAVTETHIKVSNMKWVEC